MARYGSLEVFKFCCYLSIPILMTYFIAGNPRNLEAIIRNVRLCSVVACCRTVLFLHEYSAEATSVHLSCMFRQRAYVVYPPEGPRPPSAEEMQERMQQSKPPGK